MPQAEFVPFVDGLRRIALTRARQPLERLGPGRPPRGQLPQLRAQTTCCRRPLPESDDRAEGTTGWPR